MPSTQDGHHAPGTHGVLGDDLAVATTVVHVGRPPRIPGNPLNVPPEFASAYYAGGEFDYARDGTRSTAALEEAIGLLEGGTALAFASGMAAATAILDSVAPGGRVVAPRFVYTGVRMRLLELQRTGRIDLRWVDVCDLAAVADAVVGADLMWVESPTNPMLEVADLPAVIELAHAAGARVLCDNTFATPLGQRPLNVGADLVLHSATKSIGGHSDLLAGIVVCRRPEDAEDLRVRRTLMGGFPGAMECFLALRGLRTLEVRWRRSQDTAVLLAHRLAEHPRVERVRYPGLATDPGFARCARTMSGPGTIIALEVHGGAARATTVCEATRVWVHATSLGGVESLLERRRRWALENPEVPESLIRLSVGIEDPEDLWSDLASALDA